MAIDTGPKDRKNMYIYMYIYNVIFHHNNYHINILLY